MWVSVLLGSKYLLMYHPRLSLGYPSIFPVIITAGQTLYWYLSSHYRGAIGTYPITERYVTSTLHGCDESSGWGVLWGYGFRSSP
jgi:hypothetical protein